MWIHYNGRTDVLMIARSSKLLPFLQETCGRSGVRQCCGVGDGGHATGYVASVSLIAGQPWVKSIPNFSGTYLTGNYTLNFS